MRRIAVVDAPSNLGLRPPTATSVPGCAKAPGALRDNGLLTRLGARDAGCITPPRYDPAGWQPGDGVAQSAEIAAFVRRLADRIGSILAAGDFPVVLGGDCSILLGAGLAMRRHAASLDGRVGLVYVDGHSDFRHEGNASYVGAAAGEALALATGRGQANLASIEQRRPYFRDVDVVLLGIRTHDEYRLDLQAAGIVARAVPELRSHGAARSAQWARDQLRECAGFWVHVDVDVLDPAVMPAVDAPDVGGIAYRELEILLSGLVSDPRCVGVQVTVFDPDYDPDGQYAADVTDVLVAGLEPLVTSTGLAAADLPRTVSAPPVSAPPGAVPGAPFVVPGQRPVPPLLMPPAGPVVPTQSLADSGHPTSPETLANTSVEPLVDAPVESPADASFGPSADAPVESPADASFGPLADAPGERPANVDADADVDGNAGVDVDVSTDAEATVDAVRAAQADVDVESGVGIDADIDVDVDPVAPVDAGAEASAPPDHATPVDAAVAVVDERIGEERDGEATLDGDSAAVDEGFTLPAARSARREPLTLAPVSAPPSSGRLARYSRPVDGSPDAATGGAAGGVAASGGDEQGAEREPDGGDVSPVVPIGQRRSKRRAAGDPVVAEVDADAEAADGVIGEGTVRPFVPSQPDRGRAARESIEPPGSPLADVVPAARTPTDEHGKKRK